MQVSHPLWPSPRLADSYSSTSAGRAVADDVKVFSDLSQALSSTDNNRLSALRRNKSPTWGSQIFCLHYWFRAAGEGKTAPLQGEI